ncbi:hypothetical protein MSS93_15365 [Deinococcus radiodurans]|nr:hypothetical protein MSS93_15365 [Deinococcus radiodurans]
MTQAAQALLSYWGVLAAYVGLNPHHRPRATELLWAELLGKQGAQLTQPASLASAALWAALWPLHGGLPRPEQSDVVRLATALRQPAEACGPLPPRLTSPGRWPSRCRAWTLPMSRRRPAPCAGATWRARIPAAACA